MHPPTVRTAHTTAFVTPVVEHWLEREIAQWVHHMKDRSDDPSHRERTPIPLSYISLLSAKRCHTTTCLLASIQHEVSEAVGGLLQHSGPADQRAVHLEPGPLTVVQVVVGRVQLVEAARDLHADHAVLVRGRLVLLQQQVGHVRPDHSLQRTRRKYLLNDALNTFYLRLYGRKEGKVLFNDALNTLYLRLYGVGHVRPNHSLQGTGRVLFNDALNTLYLQLYEGRKEMFYLTTHSTHFIYGYMASAMSVPITVCKEQEGFYLTTHSTHYIYSYMEGRKEMFYLTMHSTHFIYGYMVSAMSVPITVCMNTKGFI